MRTFSISELKQQLSSPAGDKFLSTLYGAKESREQRERYLAALAAFEGRFGDRQALIVSAPGRTELAGNHTDHQHGCVLCAALTVDTLCVVSPREDTAVTILSEGYGETELDLADVTPEAAEAGSTAALVRGMAAGVAPFGVMVCGFDAYVTSGIPAGGGFSSSASFEVLMGAVFCALGDETLPPLTVAKLGQRTENVWFGKPCGLMDQSACALGGVVMLDFRDPTNPGAETVNFDFGDHGWALAAVSVGSSHADLTEEYAAIPGEMGLVAEEFGMKVLRFVDREEFEQRRGELAEKLPPRALLRAEHYFDENERVSRMAEALRRGDVETYRREMLASGRSSRERLQNIIPDSHPEERRLAEALDRSAELLGEEGAWRVHGGGFGGSIQALMPMEKWEGYRAAMNAVYGAGAAQLLHIRPCGAAVFPPEG